MRGCAFLLSRIAFANCSVCAQNYFVFSVFGVGVRMEREEPNLGIYVVELALCITCSFGTVPVVCVSFLKCVNIR